MVARELCKQTSMLAQYGHLVPLLVLLLTTAVQMCGCLVALPHSLDMTVWRKLNPSQVHVSVDVSLLHWTQFVDVW